MSPTASREAYFEAGLEILASDGYGALKQSVVCQRLGVTTGSFYHFFKNWSAYTNALVDYWFESRTLTEMKAASTEANPTRRIEGLIEFGLSLPHGAEAAIRTWASIDPDVRKVQVEADRKRYTTVFDAVAELLDEEAANRYASWALYLLTGYEQSTLPRDVEVLEWAARHITDSLAREVEKRQVPSTIADGASGRSAARKTRA